MKRQKRKQSALQANTLLQAHETTYLFEQGWALHQQGRIDQAKIFYEQVLHRNPGHFHAMYLLGALALQAGHFERAAVLLAKAVQLAPENPYALNNCGIALKNLRRLTEALGHFDRAVALKPDYAEAIYNRGNALKELGRMEDALSSYDEALRINPAYANALYNRGVVLQALDRTKDALESYDQTVAVNAGYAEAYNNRGVLLQDLERNEEALADYKKAIDIKPDYAEAFNNCGIVLHRLKRYEEAILHYDKAIEIKKDFAEAYSNRGLSNHKLKRLQNALLDYEKAISLDANYAKAYFNRGDLLAELGRIDDAVLSYDKAIAFHPEFAEAFFHRGYALGQLQRTDEALFSLRKAVDLPVEQDFTFGIYLSAKQGVCDWSGLDEDFLRVKKSVSNGEKIASPFSVLGFCDDPALQRRAAEIYGYAEHAPENRSVDFPAPPSPHKIRVGYYSADFYTHATAFLMSELFEAHDADCFELYGFSFGVQVLDEMNKRIASAFDHFIDVSALSDREIVELSRKLQIDMAIDLKGYTRNSRMDIFAGRCAPIQVNYLGYPGTTGMPYIDYIIADEVVIPEDSQCHYSEKVVYLPHSYQVNDSKRPISDRVFTRQEVGLPEQGFVFCCFNNNYKIQPPTFDGWMRILLTVPGSVLWLLEDNPTAAKNLRKEAVARGVDPDRLVFAPRMKLDEHLARHKLADLFIDTLPCNAHTTASDALWAGLPVLTCMGKAFAARVAASLLHALDLPELVTETQPDYEALAIELATHPTKLQQIKAKLWANRTTSPLFNGRQFARHIEAAYVAMYERHKAGLEPAPLTIKA